MIKNIYELNKEYQRLCKVATKIVEEYEQRQNQDAYYNNIHRVFLKTIFIEPTDELKDIMLKFEVDIFWYNQSVEYMYKRLADKELIPPIIQR